MSTNNNQGSETANVAAVQNKAIVEKATQESPAVVVPQPKVVTHLQDMVEQHAAIREARMKLAQQKQQEDSAAQAAEQQTQSVAEAVEQEGATEAAGSTEVVEEAPVAENEPEAEVKKQDELGNRAKKTINKLTARAKTAEEQAVAKQSELENLKAELEQLKLAQQQKKQRQEYQRDVTADEEKSWGEYAREHDVGKLQTELKKLTDFRDEINDALDIGHVKTDDSGKEYLLEIGGRRLDKAELVSIRRDLNKRINDALPSRIKAISEVQYYKQQTDALIPQWVPEVKDQNSDIYQELDAIKRGRFGWVLNESPEAELYLTLGIKAAKERLSSNVTTAAPKAQVKAIEKIARPAPRANVPTVAGPSLTSSDITTEAKQEYERLRLRARQTQNEDDMARAMAFKAKHKIQ